MTSPPIFGYKLKGNFPITKVQSKSKNLTHSSLPPKFSPNTETYQVVAKQKFETFKNIVNSPHHRNSIRQYKTLYSLCSQTLTFSPLTHGGNILKWQILDECISLYKLLKQKFTYGQPSELSRRFKSLGYKQGFVEKWNDTSTGNNPIQIPETRNVCLTVASLHCCLHGFYKTAVHTLSGIKKHFIWKCPKESKCENKKDNFGCMDLLNYILPANNKALNTLGLKSGLIYCNATGSSRYLLKFTNQSASELRPGR